MLQPMAISAFTTPTSYVGWRDYGIPCSYIKCLQDVGVTGEICDMYITRMKEAGVDVSVESLDTGHSPFWSAPEVLSKLLQKIVEKR